MTSEDILFYPTHVERRDWLADSPALIAQRAPWCAAADDTTDTTAWHYIASRGERPVGYLRIGGDGELQIIGAEVDAQDIEQALLRFAMLDSPLHDLSRLYAPATEPWRSLLPAMGFAPSTRADEYLDYFPPPHRTQQASGSELVRLEHMDDLRQFSLDLVKSAKRSVVIYSEDLDFWLYDNEEFANALMALIHSSQFATVRLLVRDTRALKEKGHRLLTLCHHANEHASIRKITAANNTKQPAYLIVDDKGLLFRPDSGALAGIGYMDYRGRVKTLLSDFDIMWNVAYPDHNLRQMTM